jgi:uncharacterized membrane protein YgdD (TMEM256/DUF423 family)
MSTPNRDPDMVAIPLPMRLLAAFGAFACAVAVAAGAYATHAALASQNREFLSMAALFLFANGLGLAALAPATRSRLRGIGLYIVLVGTILFAGSLAGLALLDLRPALAPLGGSLLMLGWLVVAVGFLFE